jgi:DNA polymerase-3 subunit gamma/tau
VDEAAVVEGAAAAVAGVRTATAPPARPPAAANAPAAATATASAAATGSSTPPWEEDVPFEYEQERQVAEPPAPGRAEAVQRPATAAEAPVVITPTAFGDRWAALVRELIDANAIAAMVRELALQAECTAIDEGEQRFALRVERESLRGPVHADKLQAALTALLGHPVALAVQAGTVGDTPARRELAARERRQAEAEALIHNDPLVQQMTARYRTARIVPGSIKPV